MRISIFGLGYVGAVSLACLARDGHHVIGVDIDSLKLSLIGKGKSPIVEEGLAEIMANGITNGRIQVSSDVDAAIMQSELSFLCVGTPSLPNGEQDQSAMLRLAEQLGRALRQKHEYHLLVFRSTLTPGTVDGTLIPILREYSGKQEGLDFDVCFQPEFLREGSSIEDYDCPPFTIVGTNHQRAADKLRQLFGHLPNDFIVTSLRSAEMMKYTCNAFHALKITFANEIGRICQALGVDSHEVMDLVCRDTQLNISRAYLKPGFAFGGSCLPKDLRAMLYIAKSRDLEVPMLAGVVNSNKVHLARTIDFVIQARRRKIGLVGLSFKNGTDDLRESPLVELAETLIGKGLDLMIYDPQVNVSRLMGANKRFIENSIPHIAALMTENYIELVDSCEILIVGIDDKKVFNAIKIHSRPEQIVLDLVKIPDQYGIKSEYHGVCW